MKRLKKSIVSIVLCLAMVIGNVNIPAEDTLAAKKPKLNKTKLTLSVGKKYKLKVRNYKGKIVWKSSRKKVATVKKNGVVKARKKGTAKVTARLKKTGKKLSCKVTVKKAVSHITDSGIPDNITIPLQTNIPDTANTVNNTTVPSGNSESNITTAPGPTDAAPTAETTSEPAIEPTAEPTVKPTVKPSAEPTAEPVTEPTAKPSAEPTAEPVTEPTAKPTAEPVTEPTVKPSAEPTAEPVTEPTAKPSAEPTAIPVIEKAGKITLTESQWWESLLSFITFGLYEKTQNTFTIESYIDDSDIYYYVVNDGKTTALSVDELNALPADTWKKYTDKVTLKDEYNVVYARIFDNVTQTSYYISTDGIRFEPEDTQAPEYTATLIGTCSPCPFRNP